MKGERMIYRFRSLHFFGAVSFLGLIASLAASVWLGLFSSGTALALDYHLPDTGQTKCYDNSGEIACPKPGESFYGQDGNYKGAQPAYKDNGDDTVTDLNTFLMWQQDDDGVQRDWQSAMDYCGSLQLAGYADWRLPSDVELMSIVIYGNYNPAINTEYFPNCRSSYYWSGSTYAYNQPYAWDVDFSGGSVYYDGKTNDYYVRCVRTGS